MGFAGRVTTFYRDNSVRVTAEAVEVGGRRFPIPELRYVWHQRGQQTLRTASRRLGRLALIAVLVLPMVAGALMLGRFVGEQYGTAAMAGAVALVLLIGLVLLMLLSPLIEYPMMALERSYDRGTTVHEIWVRWHDQEMMLVRTADAARFGRIYRAIERAIERDED